MQIVSVRLIFAIAASSVAALFVYLFSEYSALAHKYAHPDQNVVYSALNEILRDRSAYAFAIPCIAVVMGVGLTRKSKWPVLLETLIQCCWLFALAWPLFAILSWQLENIPHINLKGLHW